MTQWTPIQGLKAYSRVLGRKMLFIFLAWLAVYWVSQPFRAAAGDNLNILMLFSPLIGAFAGLVVGWYLATDSVEDSGMTGLGLWAVLITAGCLSMWAMEGLMFVIFRRTLGFGGWMLMAAAMILTLAAAVWHASSQE